MKKKRTPLLLKLVRWIFPRLETIAPFLAHRFFVTVFFTPLSYPVPEKERTMAERASRFRIRVNGLGIQCYSWGEGPPVLVVHGWAGRATQFRKFIPQLNAAGFRVFGFDGPAHGRSDGRRTDIQAFSAVIRKICEQTGPPVAAICHSFGGAAVLYAVAKEEAPITRVINIASPTIGNEIINTYLRAVGGTAGTGEFFKAYVRKKTGKSFDDFTALHLIQQLKQEIDLLLVHDENDRDVTIRHPLELLKVYPKAKLYTTTGLGHTRILKDEKVIRKCVTFVSEGRLGGKTA